MFSLYPSLEPYRMQYLKCGGHTLYVEESGNPGGFPVLFLHGGPGAGCKPHHRGFFDPAVYRIILLDQRGAGRSLPAGELRHNTTADLVADLECIRRDLRIATWLLFAGSWGATLALRYAEAHAGRVAGLILRGAFLAREADLDWFIGERGVRRIYPEAWEELLHGLPEDERTAPLQALYRYLTGPDELAQRRAARAWEHWGRQVVLGEEAGVTSAEEHVTRATVHQARIELHYAVHGYFISENAILDGCPRLAHLPTHIIHGRRDLVCPVEAAYRLHRALPRSTLCILPRAGHIAAGEDMINALVEATETMAITLGLKA